MSRHALFAANKPWLNGHEKHEEHKNRMFRKHGCLIRFVFIVFFVAKLPSLGSVLRACQLD